MAGILFPMLFVTPVIVWVASRSILKGRLRDISVAALSAICIYILIIGTVAYVNHKLDAELAVFDLDGDGFFGGEEITPEQEAAMQRVVHDTGRALAPYVGAVFSVIYFVTVWLLLTVVTSFWNRYHKRNGH